MNVRLEKLASFTVIGKVGQGQSADSHVWIPALWQEANHHFGEIRSMAKTDESGMVLRIWGAMSDVSGKFERWTDQGLYMAGCEVFDGSVAPDGWTKWVIPAYKYAIIACSQSTYQQVFHDMLNEYLPGHSHTLVGAVHECYDPNNENGELSLYFPVERLG